MISHQHKCIFIHIPKCAGTTIKYLLFPDETVSWKEADYDKLHGWCPERKFFMQHATAKQLIETGLVTPEIWKSYYKFTFVRNPWDRAASDYFWMKKDRNIEDSFKNYLLKQGKFKAVLNDVDQIYYRGDHTTPQTQFFDIEGDYQMDYIGRFENFNQDMKHISNVLGLNYSESVHINKAKKKKKHYSNYYTEALKLDFEAIYKEDLLKLDYQFEAPKASKFSLKNIFRF